MKTLLFLVSLPLAAQSLSMSCPPKKPNRPTVCSLAMLAKGVVGAQWNLKAVPALTMTVASTVAGKSIGSNNGLYIINGMNANTIIGKMATITIPAQPPHSNGPMLTLSNALGVDAKGHGVPLGASISVNVN